MKNKNIKKAFTINDKKLYDLTIVDTNSEIQNWDFDLVFGDNLKIFIEEFETSSEYVDIVHNKSSLRTTFVRSNIHSFCIEECEILTKTESQIKKYSA